jgi:ribosomal-protein-alanine N-acetyltransferase
VTAPESLQTARLLLRKPRLEDAAAMFAAYGQDPEVTRYLTWHPHTDPSEADIVIKRFLARWQDEGEFCWMIFDRRAEELIGSIAARREKDGFNLGFVLARRWSAV